MKENNNIQNSIIACMCEGGAETAIMNMLLDNKLLIFSREQLLEEEVIPRCKAKDFENKYLGKSFQKDIVIYRTIDSRREGFKISKAYKHKIKLINVITAPEIELLVIIKEGKYHEYTSKYSHTKPSTYCKDILKFKDVKKQDFIYNYFSNINELVNAIKEYKRVKKIDKSEKCLADLLK